MDKSDFKNIAIVGVGLIGGSLGLALKRTGSERRVFGISRKSTIRKALQLGAIDDGCAYEEMKGHIAEADLVFLCTPILRIQELLREISRYVKDGAVITDVGSTKEEITATAESVLKSGAYFVGGHPMAGSESRGVGASDPFLFQNAIYVLTPGKNVPDEVSNSLEDLLKSTGAKIIKMSPSDHDTIAAAISHLPQMMAVALVQMVGNLNEENGLFLQLAAGGFRDMTRIASSPYTMWEDICATNTDRILGTIDCYISYLEDTKTKLKQKGLEEAFRAANRTRDSIPKDSKGFLRPHPEILAVAEDRPGAIAKISGILADENINISDIEVLKVREGEGGTLRLAFEGNREADKAVELLTREGYEARRR